MDRVQRVGGAAAGTGGPQGRPDDISRRGDTGTSGAGAPTAIASACPISVLVPTYNRHDTLLKCLGALETQTVGVFEVVVVDDGSTDGTETALSGRSFRFPLRYYRQTNQGPGVARNLAMEVAQGEVVLFIGDDIIADARLLEQHLVAHTRHPEPGAAILGHIDWPPWLERTAVKREATANYFRATAEHFKDEAERFKGKLAEILSSPSWRLVRRLQAIRLRLFPRGSQRERLYLRLRDRCQSDPTTAASPQRRSTTQKLR